MPYTVINEFYDKEQSNHLYKVGDEYPHKELKTTKKRTEQLLNVHPKYKRAFIEEVKEDINTPPTKE